jgi:hypothetical protein
VLRTTTKAIESIAFQIKYPTNNIGNINAANIDIENDKK